MTSAEIQALMSRAGESHEAAKLLLDRGIYNFSAVVAAYGKEFAKTKTLDPEFHRHMIIVERRRAIAHYGEESNVSEEDARESFQWADEFMQAVNEYLKTQS